jgi:hypothetical protein
VAKVEVGKMTGNVLLLPLKSRTGEYRNFVHVFSMIEQSRPDNPGTHIKEHYSYPWPAPCLPTIDYIDAVYNLSRFEFWPRAWLAFWAEFSLCGAVTQPWHARQGSIIHGPYMMLLHKMGPQTVAQRIVALKRGIRADHMRAKVHIVPEIESMDALQNELTARTLAYFKPFLVQSTSKEI